ncbi:hypothetical protein [Lysobacter brunescens]|uniref:Transmembrane protein n=1 Tax=Lysobacter brunescens TaxID=262323 RepID=A0ABW2YEV8_9GAMM
MSNPYRPPDSPTDQPLPSMSRRQRCGWAFLSGFVWAALFIGVIFILTATEPLHVAAMRLKYERVVAIASGCGAVCAALVLFIPRFPVWLNLFIGLVPILLLIIFSMFF